MWLVVGVVALVVLVATYVTWTANRVDRLHQRATGAYAALDAQSVRRAAAAVALGERDGLAGVAAAAQSVLSAHPDDRESAENDLTHALRSAAAKVEPADLAGVEEANRRLALARQVYTDLVRDALAVRRRRLVRLLGLTRGHAEPRFFDIDEPSIDEA
jgi:hypothetical protein